jgi:hypothetical protein
MRARTRRKIHRAMSELSAPNRGSNHRRSHTVVFSMVVGGLMSRVRCRLPHHSRAEPSPPRTMPISHAGPKGKGRSIAPRPSCCLFLVPFFPFSLLLVPCDYPCMSNCSGCSVASLFTRMFFPVRSSKSVNQRALLALRTFTVSGCTRTRTSAFSKCLRILRSSM